MKKVFLFAIFFIGVATKIQAATTQNGSQSDSAALAQLLADSQSYGSEGDALIPSDLTDAFVEQNDTQPSLDSSAQQEKAELFAKEEASATLSEDSLKNNINTSDNDRLAPQASLDNSFIDDAQEEQPFDPKSMFGLQDQPQADDQENTTILPPQPSITTRSPGASAITPIVTAPIADYKSDNAKKAVLNKTNKVTKKNRKKTMSTLKKQSDNRLKNRQLSKRYSQRDQKVERIHKHKKRADIQDQQKRIAPRGANKKAVIID